jgi:hypothetical protein
MPSIRMESVEADVRAGWKMDAPIPLSLMERE